MDCFTWLCLLWQYCVQNCEPVFYLWFGDLGFNWYKGIVSVWFGDLGFNWYKGIVSAWFGDLGFKLV